MDVLAISCLGPRAQFHQIDRMHNEIAAVHGGILDTIPVSLAVLNEFRQVLFTNVQFNRMLKLQESSSVLGKRLGEICGCSNAQSSLSGCGTSRSCPGCPVFKAVYRAGLGEGLCEPTVLPAVGAIRVCTGWGASVGNLLQVCAIFPV
ncbi:MAG: hypothetical protein ACLGSA_15920 [Acidobacteriota bacterium]